MFSATGWIRIEEAEYRDEFGRSGLDAASCSGRGRLAVLSRVPRPESAWLQVRNAEVTILINDHSNHRLPWPTELFREIASIAPGSFGFLHVYDDEHPSERHRFMRWSMVHGHVEVAEDTTLVPIVRCWYDGTDPRAPEDNR